MKCRISKEQYEEYHERHIELWDWCFHHPSSEKYNCPMWRWNDGPWEDENGSECHACDACGFRCGECPVDWGKPTCSSEGSPFDKWCDAGSPKTRKKYAALVRDAKWMPYEEWIKL